MKGTVEVKKPSENAFEKILDGLTSFLTRTKVVAKFEGPKQEIVDDIKRSFGSNLINIKHPDSDKLEQGNPEENHVSGKYVEFVINESMGMNQVENTLEKEVRSFLTVERGILKI